jgi:hypothetical protein
VRGEWKLIVPNPAIEREAKSELYHLATDPTETENAIDREPEMAAAMRSELDRWWR